LIVGVGEMIGLNVKIFIAGLIITGSAGGGKTGVSSAGAMA